MTFVHPAAVLPLMRGPLVSAALVAGALAPDVPYFLRALDVPVSAQSWWEPFLNATTTHAWPGLVTVAMPLALVLYLALVACGRPARWALPAASDLRGGRDGRGGLWLVWVVVSLALGVLTHVLWDSFTHSDGWVVTRVDALRTEAVGSLTWARLLQHLSTVVGLVVLVVYAWKHRRAWLVAGDPDRRTRWLRVLAVVIAAAVVGAVTLVLLQRDGTGGLEHLLSGATIGAGLGAGSAVAGLSLLWWVVRPDRRAGPDRRTVEIPQPEEAPMGLGDKISNAAEDAKGKVKEATGSATDNERLEAEGKGDQTSASAKKAGENVKDVFRD